MSALRTTVRRHRFLTFVALTYVLTWTPWTLVVFRLRADPAASVTSLVLAGGFGPFLAAVLVAAAGGDLRSWLANLVSLRAPLRAWVAAIALPVGLYGSALGVYVLLGGQFDRVSVLPAAALPALVFATLVRGGLEEPGWRGMALPALQRRVGAFWAGTVIGLVWVVWHVPLFLMPGSSQAGTSFALYAVTVVGISLVATWLYNAADGRVLPAVVFHTLSNAVSVATGTGVVGVAAVPAEATLAVVVWAVVAALVWRYGTERLSDGPLPDGGLAVAADADGRRSGGDPTATTTSGGN
jgi:membrane protease YdiL (CAAX protease family)